MSIGQRLRGFWDSVRPRTRRGGVLAAVAILGGAVALSRRPVRGRRDGLEPVPRLHAQLGRQRQAVGRPAAVLHGLEHLRQVPRGAAGPSRVGQPRGHRLPELPRRPARARRGGRQGRQRPGRRCRVPDRRGLRPLPHRGRPADRRSSARSCPASTTSRRASSATTRTRASPTGRRSCSHPLEDLPPCLTCHGPGRFQGPQPAPPHRLRGRRPVPRVPCRRPRPRRA